VKKLNPNTETMKGPFEKGLKFMSRLDNSNMVCMAGICYGNTPYTTMKY